MVTPTCSQKHADLHVPDIQGASLASAIWVKAVKKFITY
jgi:hypothetical protein